MFHFRMYVGEDAIRPFLTRDPLDEYKDADADIDVDLLFSVAETVRMNPIN